MVTRYIYVDKHWPLACSENVCVYVTVSDTMYLRGGGIGYQQEKERRQLLGDGVL